MMCLNCSLSVFESLRYMFGIFYRQVELFRIIIYKQEFY